jgi:hypothetical protein
MIMNKESIKLLREQSVAFEPTWAAHNDAAIQLVDHVFDTLKLNAYHSSTNAKYKRVIASILAFCGNVLDKADGRLALPKDRSYWAPYGMGMDIINPVFDGMEKQGWLYFVEGSGKFYLLEAESGKIERWGLVSQYLIDDSLCDLSGFYDAAWVEIGKPPMLVGISETIGTKIKRKNEGRKKPKLPISKVKKQFAKDYSKIVRGVKLLGDYWQEHPLCLPPKDNNIPAYAASATRVFHDGRIDSGGRYYGAWTSISGNQRLLCSIDEEPVVQIDLNASQPTLFSSLMGQTMEVGDLWDDLYAEVIRDLGAVGGKDDEPARRKKIKQCAVEVIGTGNIGKSHPAIDSGVTWGDADIGIPEWQLYKNTLLYYVPALSLLEPRYDKKGKPTGYLNGSGFISFHEAEIIRLTLEALVAEDIPAYPVHDCLICRRSDQDKAVETYRAIIRDYVLNMNDRNKTKRVDITVPVSIEEAGKSKVRLSGCYNT